MSEAGLRGDVGVIGCGIFGLATAAWAALGGKSVVACDRGPIGAGSSGRSGAIIRAYYHNEVLARAAVQCRREAWELFDQVFERRAGGEPVFRRSGGIYLAPAAERSEAGFASWDVDLEAIDGKALAAALPWLRALDAGEMAWWEEQAGHVETGLALAALRDTVRAHGGVVAEWTPVTRATLEDGGTWRLETASGAISVGALVVAPGPWAAAVGRLVAVDLPVSAIKVQVTLINRQATLPGDLPVIIDPGADFYSRSVAGGVSHVGFVSHRDHLQLASMDDFDESIRGDLVAELHRGFGRTVPAAAAGFVHGHRAAAYEVTPDEQFILGRGPRPNLYFAAGGSGHGYKFGPLIGRERVDLIDGREAPFVTAPQFAWDRDYRAARGMFGR